MVAGALAPTSGQPIWRVHFLASGYCSMRMSMRLMLVTMMMLMSMAMM